MNLRDSLYKLIEKKRMEIIDMQYEMHTLLTCYHFFPKEDIQEEHKKKHEE